MDSLIRAAYIMHLNIHGKLNLKNQLKSILDYRTFLLETEVPDILPAYIIEEVVKEREQTKPQESTLPLQLPIQEPPEKE